MRARYELLPYYYTLFWHAHMGGATVARPLFFEFPNDVVCYPIDKQFMIGSGVLISPVLQQGAVSTVAYFPTNDNTTIWYDFWTRTHTTSGPARWIALHTPIDKIQVRKFYSYIRIVVPYYIWYKGSSSGWRDCTHARGIAHHHAKQEE